VFAKEADVGRIEQFALEDHGVEIRGFSEQSPSGQERARTDVDVEIHAALSQWLAERFDAQAK
jgi:hypothetical protein